MSTIQEKLKNKFAEVGNTTRIPLMPTEQFFTASITEKGIVVDNLPKDSLLPWSIFEEVVKLLNRNNGSAIKGDAMKGRLGDELLPFDSIEGHVAASIYGQKEGDIAYRRISPVSAILSWSGICNNHRGSLSIKEVQVIYPDIQAQD